MRQYQRILFYVVLIILSLINCIPVYMTFITALKSPEAIAKMSAWIPSFPLHWDSFIEAFDRLKSNILNSVILTVVATGISALIGSINGYVFAKNKFFGSNIIFILILFGMFIPYQIILIPLFNLLNFLELYGSLSGLILAHVVYGIPIVTLIFRNYYEQIPQAMIESANIDGAGFFKTFFHIILPLSLPGFVVVTIWQTTQIWNEFLWGICLAKGDNTPITVGLSDMAGGQAVSWNIPMAGSIIAALPIVLIYIFLSKYFIQGLFSGSVKE
ncbi:MAG: carbohydrate ABC transporter permease [Chitinispirillia bacterium]